MGAAVAGAADCKVWVYTVISWWYRMVGVVGMLVIFRLQIKELL